MNRIVVALAAATALLAGCSSSPTSPSASPSSAASSADPLSGTITVFAAASLNGAFTEIGKQFEAAHPATKVQFSFLGSSALATQINQGAPADVFASAAPANMQTVVQAGNAADPVNFASNSLEIAVPPDNPAKITGLADLARAGVKVAVCQPQVPCGATAATVFQKANLTVTPVTLEPDVTSTLTKVTEGEVDAGVVYVTDVKAAGSKVKGIEIPTASNTTTEYPIVTLKATTHPDVAKAFTAYVTSAAGQQVLTAAGFAGP